MKTAAEKHRKTAAHRRLLLLFLSTLLPLTCVQNLNHILEDEYPAASTGSEIPDRSGPHPGASLDTTAPALSGHISFGSITGSTIEIHWPTGSDDITATTDLQYKVVLADKETEIDTVSEADAISGGLYLISEFRKNYSAVTAENLSSSTTYRVNVIVKDEAGNMNIFNPAVVSTREVDNTAPNAGSAITFTAADPSSITLKWGRAFDDISPAAKILYRIVKSTASTNIDTIAEADAVIPGPDLISDYTADLTSVTASSLNASTTYWFSVIARDEAGNKVIYNPASQSTPATADTTAPAAGSGGTITFSSVNTDSLQLDWAAASDSVTETSDLQYKVIRALSSGDIDTITEADAVTSGENLQIDYTPAVTELNVGFLNAATTYYFTVIVKDQAGNRALYGPQAVTTAALPVETDNLTDIESGFVTIDGTYVPDAVVTGGLKNKRIAMAGGHGYKKSSTADWQLQRWWHYNGSEQGPAPHARSFVEDFVNNDLMWYFQRFVSNAGAYTLIERETSRQYRGLIVTTADSGFNGKGNTSLSTADGVFSGRFSKASYGYEYMYGDPSGNKSFEFSFNVPEDGIYPVYYHWRSSYNRADNIPVSIDHAGGRTDTYLHQKTRGPAEGSSDYHGSGYNRYQMMHLGEYYFKAGTAAKVIVYNRVDSSDVIIADAVRIGGGMSPVENGGNTTGHELNESDALSFQEYLNRPPTVLTNDVTTRPHAANYEAADAYISIHNNAGGSHGTMIIWERQGQSYSSLSGLPLQSKNLAHAVEDRMVSLIRERYDSSWQDIYWGDEGFDGNYGETRVADIPAVLIEIGFFDHSSDWWALADESFQRLATLGMVRGLADYYSAGYAPEEVEAVYALNDSGGCDLKVGWQPPSNGPAASHYIIRRSTDGYAFDSGKYTADTYACYNNVSDSALYYFKVYAMNSDGISLPSETIAVKRKSGTEKSLLIVNGFDRLDSRVNNARRYAVSGIPPVHAEGNLKNYVVQHAGAVVDSGKAWYFDYASNEAVVNGTLSLSAYDAVDWYVGRESTGDETFSESEHDKIEVYLDSGGSLMASGAEIGWELGRAASSPSAADLNFYNNYLKAAYDADDAGTEAIADAAGSLFNATSGSFTLDDGSKGVYKNYFPDVLSVQSGAVSELAYSGGSYSGQSAVISYNGTFRVLYFGFPFEIIDNSADRATVMAIALDFLGGS